MTVSLVARARAGLHCDQHALQGVSVRVFRKTGLTGIRLLYALLVLLPVVPALVGDARAETRDYYFERIDASRGLAQNTVTALAQDAQGFVWVGTQGGLHRYDGQRYRLFRHDPRDPASMPESYVTALAVEGSQALWIGTYSQHVARLDLATGQIRRYPASGDDMRAPRRQVMALLAHAGKVWVGTLAGLERLDPATGGHDVVLRLDPQTARDAPWQALAAGPDGAIWYGSAAGLYRIGQRGGIDRIGPAMSVRSLLFDHAGRLWVGSADGLYRLQDGGRALLRVWPGSQDRDVGAVDVRSLVEAPDRHLWLSAYGGGLRRYDPATGVFERIRETPLVAASLPEDSIAVLMLDRGGTLWAGGGFRGPSVTDPLGTRFRYLFHPDPLGQSGAIAGNSIRSTFEDSARRLVGRHRRRAPVAAPGAGLAIRGRQRRTRVTVPGAAARGAVAGDGLPSGLGAHCLGRDLARTGAAGYAQRRGQRSRYPWPRRHRHPQFRARSRRQPVARHLRPRPDALLARRRAAAAVWRCGGRLSQPGVFGPRRSAWARLERHRRWPRPARSGYGSHAPFPPSSRPARQPRRQPGAIGAGNAPMAASGSPAIPA